VATGATNVQWVWCPNVDWDGHHPVAPYYPGAAYVDWLGMDGYNKAQHGWHTFTQIFQATYHELLALHGTAPIMIGEMAASEATSAQARRGLSKAGWITSAYGREMVSFPRSKAVTWFNEDKSAQEKCLCDWRIESSAAATRAFAHAVAPPVYRSTWPWGIRPVITTARADHTAALVAHRSVLAVGGAGHAGTLSNAAFSPTSPTAPSGRLGPVLL
jgi:hypothetical protein